MNILITGGGGFLGNRLAHALLARPALRLAHGPPQSLTSLTLADLGFAPASRVGLPAHVTLETGDVASPDFITRLIRPDTAAIFHLAAMVSGDGERDFDGCLRANLTGTHSLLEHARATGRAPVVVYASSLAVFGGHCLSPVVSDITKPLPQTTYGMTKLIGELLLADYTRKGFIDGRAARLPTVFIRPGKPNAAASSFASGLFREPLARLPHYLPVPRTQAVPLVGYRRVIANLIRLAEADSAWLGADRTVTLPSSRYRIDEMITALEHVARQRGLPLGPIVDRPDPVITTIVQSWPVGTDATRVPQLGLESDASVEHVINEYLEDFPDAINHSVKA